MSRVRTSILIVDDETAVAQMCAQTLALAGYDVVTASSGTEAMAIIEVREIDIVLSDVSMAGMSGVDLLRRLPPAGAGPDVVLMTGYGSVAAAVEAIRLGAYDYILKPFVGDQLAQTVGRLAEVRALRTENGLLRLRFHADNSIGGMVGKSAGILAVSESILRVAGRKQPVLISGETGTGKELVARAIHQFGQNANGPFVAVDCGALAAGTVESELFGHVRGAFTGAIESRPGLLATAAKGTLFLDEIGELPLALQVKLFRVLQENEFRPLGGDTVRPFAGRILAATNRDLMADVKAGTFREELYFRISVHQVHVPPLRARKGDIPLLVEHFIHKHGEGQVLAISPDALEKLVAYSWPGNIRELDNCVLTMCAHCDGRVLEAQHLPAGIRRMPVADVSPASPLEEAARQTIARALASTEGNVAEAARRLGISKATLYRKMARGASKA